MEQFAFYLLMLMPIAQFMGSALPDILLSTIAVLFVFRSIVKKDMYWTRHRWLKAALVLWLYLVIRSFFAEDPSIALKASLPWIRFIIFAVAIADWLLVSDVAFERFTCSILITLLVISINTISQLIIGADIFGNQIDYTAYPRLVTPSGKLSVGIMLSFYILPLISAALLKPRNFLYHLTAGLSFISIFISGERTALILTVGGIFFIMCISQKNMKKIIAITLALVILGAGTLMLKREVIERQVVSTYQSLVNYNNSAYGIIQLAAGAIFSNNLMFGVGPKHYKVACGKYENHFMEEEQLERYCKSTSHPHNIYLEMLVDGGIVGFSLFIIFVYFCICLIFIPTPKPYKHFFKLGAGAMVIFKLFPYAPISSIYFAWSMAPFWLMLGALSSIKKKARSIA